MVYKYLFEIKQVKQSIGIRLFILYVCIVGTAIKVLTRIYKCRMST